ncbi:MAG: radical SAM protein [Phaeodactylibacter sp.]|nr:radical SAM protein [Phaeodactylibacter sp.]
MATSIKTYLQDPFLARLWTAIKAAGPVRSISMDITHVCNLRCKGCYYFEEGMDRYQSPTDEGVFDAFIEGEKERGTTFVTIVGGEPSLEIGRIKKIYDHFKCSVATNGVRKIPYEGLENLPIGVAVWGDAETDRELRGYGKADIFQKALKNYRNDPRAFWYYTVAPGHAQQIEGVVERCLDNGNNILFNYYSDISGQGGALDYRQGFDKVQQEIDRMIERFPGQIYMTPYFNQTIATGQLLDEKWGYEVCTNLSTNYAGNAERLKSGKPYNKHFRAYNADFVSTRRCCTGAFRDCSSCFDTWEHFSWIMANLRKHLATKEDFSNWLTSTYLFYFINRLVDVEEGQECLRLIQTQHRNTLAV